MCKLQQTFVTQGVHITSIHNLPTVFPYEKSKVYDTEKWREISLLNAENVMNA